jgi:hypothetical protein
MGEAGTWILTFMEIESGMESDGDNFTTPPASQGGAEDGDDHDTGCTPETTARTPAPVQAALLVGRGKTVCTDLGTDVPADSRPTTTGLTAGPTTGTASAEAEAQGGFDARLGTVAGSARALTNVGETDAAQTAEGFAAGGFAPSSVKASWWLAKYVSKLSDSGQRLMRQFRQDESIPPDMQALADQDGINLPNLHHQMVIFANVFQEAAESDY